MPRRVNLSIWRGRREKPGLGRHVFVVRADGDSDSENRDRQTHNVDEPTNVDTQRDAGPHWRDGDGAVLRRVIGPAYHARTVRALAVSVGIGYGFDYRLRDLRHEAYPAAMLANAQALAFLLVQGAPVCVWPRTIDPLLTSKRTLALAAVLTLGVERVAQPAHWLVTTASTMPAGRQAALTAGPEDPPTPVYPGVDGVMEDMAPALDLDSDFLEWWRDALALDVSFFEHWRDVYSVCWQEDARRVLVPRGWSAELVVLIGTRQPIAPIGSLTLALDLL